MNKLKVMINYWQKKNPLHNSAAVENTGETFASKMCPFCFFLKVQMHNGDVYEATIKDIDKKSDIATIKINSQVSP